MKYSLIFALLLVTSSAIKIVTKGDDDATTSELDALMDKYDDTDSKKLNKTNQKAKKDETNKAAKSGASASEVQDMELKILQGNMLADSSSKAADDDLYNEVLEKFQSPSKKDATINVLNKEAAQEACTELYEKKNGVDGFAAMEKVKGIFAQKWTDHDVSKAGFIDTSEAYGLF